MYNEVRISPSHSQYAFTPHPAHSPALTSRLPSARVHVSPPAQTHPQPTPLTLPSLLHNLTSPLLPTHPHLLAEMPNAPNLEGAAGLHILTLEEDRHASHLGQCPALQQRCDHVEGLLLGTLRHRAIHSGDQVESLQEDMKVTTQAVSVKSSLNRDKGGEGRASPWFRCPLLHLAAEL